MVLLEGHATCRIPTPEKFRDDAVRVARNRWTGSQLSQIAADFSISESGRAHWLDQAPFWVAQSCVGDRLLA